MRFLLVFLLLSLGAWGHESGQVGARARLELASSPQTLRVTLSLHFDAASSPQEWAELDTDRNGQLSPAEEQTYLAAEKAWFADGFELTCNGQRISLEPGEFKVSGNAKDLTTTATWQAPAAEGAWRLRHTSAPTFVGQHTYSLQLPQPPSTPAAFAVASEVPTLAWSQSVKGAGAPWSQEWQWTNQGGGLQAALASKTTWGALLLAFVLGALHGLTPGHGKTIVGAYLVGSRGTVAQAILLGLVVTFTHTFSVILLGVACLFLFQNHLPASAIPWIGVISGVLIVALGLALLTGQGLSFLHHHPHGEHDHHHDHDGHHHHHHGPGHHHHHHHLPEKVTLGALISLGVTGGMVPCPEALAVLLGALAINKLAAGLMILLAFSAGLAAILVLIGILMVTASRLFEKRYPGSDTVSRLSDISYCFMVLMGLAIALRSLWQTGIFSR